MNDAPAQTPQATSVSPNAAYLGYLQDGKLAYQPDPTNGKAVFYPRLISPHSGEPLREWRISAGLGTVYAVTVITPRGESVYNVVLVDMDEGFRMMSRVESVPAADVCIGMRVRVRVHVPDQIEEAPYPVFDVLEQAA